MSKQNFQLISVIGVVALGFASLSACEQSGELLFPAPIDNVPGVAHITAEDGEPFSPALIEDRADVEANTVYTEIGPTGSVLRSGVTMEFIGTGGTVCAFVDPETISWNQSVSVQAGQRRWRLPDNVFDDGDVDMQVGLSLYYRGSPGEVMAGFEIEYQDNLGNDVEVELVACRNTTELLGNQNIDAHAGRATPEYCTIENTQRGVSYTLAFEGFRLPTDDLRLGMGVLIAEGPCTGPPLPGETRPQGLVNRIAPIDPQDPLLVNQECLIRGESIKPAASGAQVFYGYDEGRAWPGSVDVELHFCTEPMNTFCNQERISKTEAGVVCDRINTGPDSPLDERCFCGDNRDSPEGGAAEF